MTAAHGASLDVARAAVALGSNLGEREQSIENACEAIERLSGTRIVARSRLYITAPVGGPPQGLFLNGAIVLETSLTPRELLDDLLAIEADLGRVRREKDGPRVIDLDLILHGDRILDEPGLQIPHPRAHERAFVLEPLAEIMPDWVHPVLNASVDELWRRFQRSHALVPTDAAGESVERAFEKRAGA